METNRGKPTRRCTTKLVSGTVKFTVAVPVRASLVRGGAVYAVGGEATVSGGREVLLRARRRIATGRYTLTVTRRIAHRTVTTRQAVTIA